jgi:hypothetical protein
MSFDFYVLWAAALAALLPLSLIATRHELRRVRFRLVQELRSNLFQDEAELPQLKLAAARYDDGRDSAGETRQSLVLVWTGAAFYTALSFAGFALLLVPADWLISEHPAFPRLTYALLWATETAHSREDIARTAMLVGIAFVGGYVFQLRYLVRATLNQELGALSFVRATLQVLQGMLVAVIAYRVGAFATGLTSGGTATAIFGAELALGFVIGMYPDIGLSRIAKIARVRSKAVDENALTVSKLIPLEIIEGIDSETAFRLQESNLFDVQNLATINPIELYAETPYGLMQVFDWVLQAQLCTNAGPEAFAALKAHKIRTIFDLERAVLADGAPDDYVCAIGAIILAGALPAETSDAAEEARDDQAGAAAEPAAAPRADAFAISPAVARHAVAIMADDLHVHRLRALWRIMLRTTAGAGEAQSPWLYRTGKLPGDDDGYGGVRIES